ncbi:tumor necrosis factor receptor superfamily member 14-like isoform X1 [Trachinotus anak]|uniref:tumor necrosis factor receptor superfamily member 14-like isoform X1 n=1 Tax=Trachinotus anak TaxID=443729 RepID=UPI0039F2662D
MTSRRKPATALFLMTLLIRVLRGNTCRPEDYFTEDRCCPRCPAGSRVKADCTESRSTSCLPCLDGTYMNNPTARRECFSCTNCDAGSGLKTKISCTPILNTVCEPLEGFYCIDTEESSCLAAEKHSTCRPGQYISNKGTASSDTECSDCSEGTFSDGTFTSCRPHTQRDSGNLQLIKPGTAATDAECGEKSSLNVTGIVIGVSVVSLILIIASVFLFVKKKEKCLPGKICVQSKKMLSWFNDEETFSQIMMLMIKMFFIGFVFILVLKGNPSRPTEENTLGPESAQMMLPPTPETGETAQSCSLSSSLIEDCLSVESETSGQNMNLEAC